MLSTLLAFAFVSVAVSIPLLDKTISQQIVFENINGTGHFKEEKYTKVFDPKLNKYAFKKMTIDNGKVYREAGFLDDNGAETEAKPTGFNFIEELLSNLKRLETSFAEKAAPQIVPAPKPEPEMMQVVETVPQNEPEPVVEKNEVPIQQGLFRPIFLLRLP